MDASLFYALGIATCVLLSAFFSGSETALTGVSRARIYRLLMQGNLRAKKVSILRNERKEDMIGAVLIGNTLVNVFASALATTAAIAYWGEDSILYITFALSIIIIVFGEVLPKTYAIHYSERMALAVSPMLLIVVKLLFPVTFVMQKLIRFVLTLFRVDLNNSNSLFSATEVIRGTIELHHQEGGVIKHDRDMLGSILDLDDIEVGQIMIHRKQLQTINIDDPIDDIIREATRSSHSRLPLYRDNADNIIGVLHIKNLFKLINTYGNRIDNASLLRIAAKPWFIPETTTLREQLLAFRERRQHFALVVDEYGALLGGVTLEDIIEEIVGEIDDETDKSGAPIFLPGPDGAYRIDGATAVRDLNRALDWSLPDDVAATIAGLVIHEARLIPDRGAVFEFFGFRFTIEDRSVNQITRIKIEKLSAATTPEIS